jgi:murein DD-endopeptidase MepM/ murein hydrolase activator NlpD
MSGSAPLVRLAAVALLAGTAAACSADTNRFSDPNSNPFAASDRMAPAYTGSVGSAPTAAVQSAPMGAPGGYQPAPSYGAPAQISPQGGQPYGGSPYGAAAPAAPASYASNPPPAAQPIYGARPQALSAPHASAAPARTPVASAGGGTHVVASGESLTSIARLYGVPRTTLAQTNKMDINGSVRIGQRITIPGSGSLVANAAKTAAPAAPAAHAAAKPATTAPVVAAAPAKPKPADTKPVGQVAAAAAADKNAQLIAAVKPAEPAEDAVKDDDKQAGMQFRWPVRGRIISGFGPKPGGQQNEGINVSVPEGTSVKAAEDGVVAYAGNELKGYGNLVLIKHADGWVTAYAHNSEIDVKKGETVKRGQTIAKAGQTGSVTSPQVHFEIRKGSQPVDPSSHLAGL